MLRLVDHCANTTQPTAAATLTFGGEGVPIGIGSHVRHPAYNFELVVVSFPDDPACDRRVYHFYTQRIRTHLRKMLVQS